VLTGVAGVGGYHIFCVPEKELLVVIASKQVSRWNDRWSRLEKCILPAVD